MISRNRLFGNRNQMTEEVLYNNLLIERKELHELEYKMKQYEKDVSDILKKLDSFEQTKIVKQVNNIVNDEDMEEGIYVSQSKLDYMQKDINELRKKMVRTEQLDGLDTQVRELNEKLINIERIGEIRKDVDKLQNRMRDLSDRVEYGFSKELVELLREQQEKNHEDCIKVYRNVQAVIVEEEAKQNKVIVDIAKNSSSIKDKMNFVFIFSAVSMIASLLVMALQILPSFGIHLFG